MISRAIVLESAMSRADVEPEPARRPTAPRTCAADRPRKPRAVVHALQQVVEEDRVRLARVRSPQEDDVRLLDLAVGRRAAARTEHRRQTDDARSVSSAVAASRCCSMPITWRANFCARKFISFVAFEQENMPKDVGRVGLSRAAEAFRGAIERLVPGGGLERAAGAYERRCETAFGHSRRSSLAGGYQP